ncbi:aa3-type cytochrome c oxidase subunit IV [Phaeovulum sp.]
MTEHAQGSMDITTQERTFEGFITFAKRAAVAIVVVLVFLAIVNG